MALPPEVLTEIRERISSTDDKLSNMLEEIQRLETTGADTAELRRKYNELKRKSDAFKRAYGSAKKSKNE